MKDIIVFSLLALAASAYPQSGSARGGKGCSQNGGVGRPGQNGNESNPAVVNAPFRPSSPEDPSNDDSSNDDSSDDDSSNDDSSNDDSSNDDSSKDDASNDDASNDDASNDDASNDDASNDGPSNDDPSNDDPSNDDSSSNPPVLNDPENPSTNGTGSGTGSGSGGSGGGGSGGGNGSVPNLSTTLPASAGTVQESAAIEVSGEFDGGMQTFERSPSVCSGGEEYGRDAAMFILADGATLSNVIIGDGQAEGVQCSGTCTLNNVWFSTVCEDAITFRQEAGTSYISGGGAFGATDKIVQFNGRGTVHISNFYAQDYGKLARSCGNCDGNSGPREFVIEGVQAVNGGELCGVNSNFGDTCTIIDSCQAEGNACSIWEATDGGGEPTQTSLEPDGTVCNAQSFQPTC